MDCPACGSSRALCFATLEPWLEASRCSACAGIWISSAAYRTWWINRQTDSSDAVLPDEARAAAEDGPYLRRCPECQHILARYRVGHGVAFSIERCRNCNGLWFDRDEWHVLRTRNLLHLLPHLTSDDWQRELHDAELEAQEEAHLLSQLDRGDVARIQEIKGWLDAHPKRTVLFRVLGIEPEHLPRR